MGYEISVKDDVVKKINDFFKPIRAKYLANGLLNPVVMGNATDALIYQVPGGMLSNLVAQLTAQKALDKLDAVLLEVPKVRKDLGYPPLVTPMSQMVGVQATVNVLTGGRYKNVSKEIKAYVKGEYGRAPGKIDPEVQKLVLGDENPLPSATPTCWSPALRKPSGSWESVPTAMRMFFPTLRSPRRRRLTLRSVTAKRMITKFTFLSVR